MEPGWVVLFLFLMFNVSVRTVRDAWAGSSYLRNTCYVLCTLNAVMFWQESAKQRTARLIGGKHCEAKAELFRAQRDTYITGFGLFTFFVATRLVSIQGHLHDSREEMKSLQRDSQRDKKVK